MNKLPVPPDEYTRRVYSQLERMDMQNYKRGQNIDVGSNSIILTAANGTRWKITVSNTGTLSTVAA